MCFWQCRASAQFALACTLYSCEPRVIYPRTSFSATPLCVFYNNIIQRQRGPVNRKYAFCKLFYAKSIDKDAKRDYTKLVRTQNANF
nr:MAG TPA: hypothetical protein [Caudoviricetes sp.]